MGKSKARLVTASEQVGGLIDRGYEIDVDLKNLSVEDKGIKKMLGDELGESFGEDTSIAVSGKIGMVTMSRSEKYAIKGDADTVEAVRNAAQDGLLGDAVKTENVLNVPVADRERAANILKAAGILATTVVEMAIDPEEYRTLMASQTTSVEGTEAKQILGGAVEKTVNYRVKYGKASA